MKSHKPLQSLHSFPHCILLLSILWAAILPVGIAMLAATPAQAAGDAWYDGPVQYSTITNCASIVQGSPYTEKGAGTYVGFLADPDNGKPAPNVIYYIHVVVAGLGNSCSGMRAYLEVGLPANTSLAIDATYKVYCFYNNVAVTPASDCPQSLPSSTYNPGMYEIPSPDSVHAYTWPIPQGKFLEIQIPVRSSTALTNSTMQAKVWMLDGNSSPWLQPQQGVYVFNSLPSSQPAILYPNPATTSIESTNAHSEVNLYTHGLGGTGYFDLGTDTSYGLIHDGPITIAPGGNAYLAWEEWGLPLPSLLLPDTLYHWRFTFSYSGGQTVGADQTFRTLPDGVATVGSGMTGSCTEAALVSALAAADHVNFACGPLPVTISLTSAKTITGGVYINGGNLVTLSTNGTTNHFNVPAFGHLFLNQIKLENGMNSTACGGSIHVLGNGQLTLTETSFDNNTSNYSGGAICVDLNGSAEIHSTQFTNNQANNGGGVFNQGTLVIDHSGFTTNNADVFGGALQNYGYGDLSEVTFDQNTAGTNGGGVDASSSQPLTLTRTTFTANTAGVRGGGINQYGGTVDITESRFIGNHSDGYGGGIANDIGTLSIQASEFSDNTSISVGGGLRSNGTTSVTNSTFSGNHSDSNGGGIENSDISGTPGTLALVNTTLAGNTAGAQGGNIYIGTITSDHVKLKNTIVSGGTPNNCDHLVASLGNNIESGSECGLDNGGDMFNKDPMLGLLGDNGGPTYTRALLAGSPAIDKGNSSGCPATDQRGSPRPLDGDGDGTATCDIGAYEYAVQAPPPPSQIPLFLPMIRR